MAKKLGHGVKNAGVRGFRKMGDMLANRTHDHRHPMDQLAHEIEKFESTKKDHPARGRIRDVLNAAVEAGVSEQKLKKEAGLRHAHFVAAANGNSPMLTRPQRHALLHVLQEEVIKDRAKRRFPGHNY